MTTNEVEMNSNITLNHFECNDGFLHGYIEVSIEKPDDGLNGDCIVHYGGEHSQCVMRVRLVNGVRDGLAMIVNDGMPYLRLEYRKGSLTGIVERFSEYGFVELRGRLVNGIEEGLFEEFDKNRKLIWNGLYQNGRRFHMVVKKNSSNECEEYYELDEKQQVKQLCVFDNGMRSRVLARFDGDVMTEFNENEKRVYVGGFNGDLENGFMRDGKGKEYANDGTEVIYSGEWKNGRRDGIGTEFKGFMPLYSGGWTYGKRDGEGEEMDENGDVIRSGRWVDGIHENEMRNVGSLCSSLGSNPREIEELKCENNSCNESSITELKLNGMARLRRIVIGDHCFGSVILFEIKDLPLLLSIDVSGNSFKNTSSFSLIGRIDSLV